MSKEWQSIAVYFAIAAVAGLITIFLPVDAKAPFAFAAGSIAWLVKTSIWNDVPHQG